jgi:outer membrane receptor for ferric coprogen and ferric-rhodotorulic acid
MTPALNGDAQSVRDPSNLLMPVEVISRSYIDETQSNDLNEALRGSAGVITESIPLSEADLGRVGLPVVNPVESRDFSPSNSGGGWGYLGGSFDNSVAIRGYTNPTQQRLGFRIGAAYGDGRSIGTLIDSVNIDHVKIYRGPAGLLFGQNTLSGVVEVVPKRPLSERLEWLRITVGSEGYKRAEADLTGPIIDKLNYRVTGAWQESDHWTDWKNSERNYGSVQLSYNPTEVLSLFVEYQYSSDDNAGIGPQFAYDSPVSDLSLGDEGEPYGEPINWARLLSGADKSFRWSGPDTYFNRTSHQLLGTADIRISESLTLNLSASLSDIDTEERNIEFRTISLTPFGAQFYPEARYFGGEYYRMLNGSFYDYNLAVESEQLKAELSYQFDFLGGVNLLQFGRSYLSDNIEEFGVSPEIGKLQQGILKSVDDPTPFRYESSVRYEDQLLNYYFGPHMVQDDTFWSLNDYVLYRGIFLEERLQIFLGSRWERFHAREFRRSTSDDIDLVVYEARQEIGPLRSEEGYRYGGKALHLNSLNGGIGLRLNDQLTAYALSTQGYNPNQGQVDGNGTPIKEETTHGLEAGLMFDLFEGRLTGWIGYYEIKRENAVWSHWLTAPAPLTWGQSTSGPQFNVPAQFVPFDPQAASTGEAPLSYGIQEKFLTTEQLQEGPNGEFLNPGLLGESGGYVYIDYAQIDDSGLRSAVETAFLSPDESAFSYNPAKVNGKTLGNNPDAIVLPSNRYYANIPFEEITRGLDFQFTYTATPQWQIEVKYAYNAREVTKMHLLDYIDPNSGINWGTEYNQQARQIGRDQFSDPANPSTIQSGLLLGNDFGVTPEQILTVWNRYQVAPSILPGLSLGLGVRYTGPQKTSVPVGGNLLAENSYPTPETKAYWMTDLSVSYKTTWQDTHVRFLVTAYNLFDKRHLEQTVHYPSTSGESVSRRSVQEMAPLSIRFSASISF